MATGELEIELPGYLGHGTISATAYEPGEPPTHVFDIHDDVNVDVEWSIPPYLNRLICGTWECDVYLESIGAGREYEVEGPFVPVNQANNAYKATILIPHDTVVPDKGETDIPYKMVVTVNFKNTLGKPGPIAGLVELPMVQFYLDE